MKCGFGANEETLVLGTPKRISLAIAISESYCFKEGYFKTDLASFHGV
jgi:hypothetical protein